MSATLFITGLTTESSHAKQFVVIVYPTSDVTPGNTFVAAGSAAAIKVNPNDTEFVQAEIIVFPNLVVGTTYYLSAGVDLGQAINYSPTVAFTPTTTVSSSTLQTYPFNVGFSFSYSLIQGNDPSILNSFIYFNLTLPTGLFSIDTTYTLDGKPPVSPPAQPVNNVVIGGFDPSNITFNTLSVFTGITSDQTITVYTRGVAINGIAYPWQFVSSYSLGGTGNPPHDPFYPDPIENPEPERGFNPN